MRAKALDFILFFGFCTFTYAHSISISFFCLFIFKVTPGGNVEEASWGGGERAVRRFATLQDGSVGSGVGAGFGIGRL